jgi:RHS repeat-associated protein
LAYIYDTNDRNKLIKVTDATANTDGFKDSADNIVEYGYDLNGNMTKDDNKQITTILYNHLNLPTQIVFNNDLNTKICYLYTATGQKVQKSVYKYYPQITANLMPAPAVVTDYLGGYQYVDATLQFFPHAEGYIKYTEGVSNPYDYVFNYTDHLGNIRLSYGADPANPALLKKYEENNYYPFGLKHKEYNNALRIIVKAEPVEAIASGKKIAIFQTDPLKPITTISNNSYNYKYNGKEYQDELGLNTFDYGFRQYMQDLGRWGSIDSKAEAYYPISPFQYVLNNPLVNADVKGQWTITRHYNMTYNSVSAAGIGKKQADLLAHYASVYADNPGANITWNNIGHPTDQNYYRNATIDYSGTKNSQITDWDGKGYNYNIWHSMRSGWEKENNTISAHDAQERGMEFGWGKIFESAKSGKLNDLKVNSAGIKAWGQGVHALQDAFAHKGTTMDEHSILNDRYGDKLGAQRMTTSATTVHNIMSGNWDAFEGKTEIQFDAQGMSRSQYNDVMNAIYQYLKKDNK